MKKAFILFAAIGIITACNNSEPKTGDTKTNETNDETKTAQADITANPAYQTGLEVEAKNDCSTCHRVAEKLTGPSYVDIANKYATAGDTVVAYLSNKIIKGGSGVWGPAAMTPHPALPQADAEAIVKYILLLKQ
jgi:cytochrome c